MYDISEQESQKAQFPLSWDQLVTSVEKHPQNN